MSEIPSTGNIGVDISIALIAGGANYMVNPLLNRLQMKKEEHMDITKQKIAKIATFETVTMQIASSLFQVAAILDKKTKNDSDYDRCVCNIVVYLYKWRSLLRESGFIQLDNIYNETLIQNLAESLFAMLLNEPAVGLQKIATC